MLNRLKIKNLFYIFCLAFFVRAIFFIIARKFYAEAWSPEKIGINHWLDIAQNFVAGHGFSHSALLTYLPMGGGLEPTAARSPVPILVLSAVLFIFKNHFYYALFAQSWFFSGVSAALLYLLADKVYEPSGSFSPGLAPEGGVLGRRRGVSQKIALMVALFYCFYLPEIYISTTYAAGSESLFTFLLMAYFYLIIRQMETLSLKLAFASGLVLALAFLSRPVVLFLPLLYIGWAVWKYRGKAAASVAAYLIAFILCVSPWVIRNQIVMGKPILTTTLGGYNLLRHNWLISRGEYRLCTAEDFLPMANETILEAQGENQVLNEVRLDEIFKRKAKEIIRQYPWRYLKLTAIRSVWLWYKIGAEKPPYLFWNLFVYLFMFPGLVLVFFKKIEIPSLRALALMRKYRKAAQRKKPSLRGAPGERRGNLGFELLKQDCRAPEKQSLAMTEKGHNASSQIRIDILRVLSIHIFYFILIHIGINAQFRFICPMMPYGILIAIYAFLEFVRRGNARDRCPKLF